MMIDLSSFGGSGGRMQRFLFHYLELFSVIGAGTPENPGGEMPPNQPLHLTGAAFRLFVGQRLISGPGR
jgi:hypothetical protein